MSSPLQQQLQSALGESYTVERELGGGGMARVFVAEERRFGRRVVVKVLSPELAAEVSAERFERETRVAAKLQDPRIVPVLSAGEAAGLPFYTMPYVDGTSLRARMSEGPVPLAAAISILRDVALALEHAHGHGIVHRDIKPENVLLTLHSGLTGTAMVTDFGIARAIADATSSSAGVALTQQGATIGTPAYMAPEQAAGDLVDHRADLYAWGVIAYELLSSAHPFADRATAGAMVTAHIRDVPEPLGRRHPSVPAALSSLVDRTLAKDPGLRPSSASALVQVLDGLTSSGAGVRRGVWSRRRVAVAAVVAVVLAAAAGVAIMRRLDNRGALERPQRGPAKSIAVLPFVNKGPDTADVYLAEGMSDDLTTALGHLDSVRVASRSSAAKYRTASALDAARALNVDAVLEGSVVRRGDRLRITAAVTTAPDGIEIWSRSFDPKASEVFDVQDEIVRAIVDSLQFALLGRSVAKAAAPRGTHDPEAYDLYLKGRYAFSRRGSGLVEAVRYYQRALARDSTFARARAGLAMAYVPMMVFGVARGDSVLPLAEASATRALAQDSTLADAHLALASVRRMQWRWDDAERHFEAAIAYAPSEATAHQWYGGLLYSTGRVTKAVEELVKARDLDPVSAALGTDVTYGLYAAHDFGKARTEAERTVGLDSTLAISHWLTGVTLLALNRPDTALRAFETARRFGDTPDARPGMVAAYRALGRARDADTLYAVLRRDYAAARLDQRDMAVAAVAVGDNPTALAAVKRSIDRRDPIVTEYSLPCDPLFDPLHADPRFVEMLARVGMRVCSVAVR
ncbi:MAG TPA: protein kinase [Gemmatimonadaceae bacterium]|nr:protein kinase [Gemmatimonadaceae bacterium]